MQNKKSQVTSDSEKKKKKRTIAKPFPQTRKKNCKVIMSTNFCFIGEI